MIKKTLAMFLSFAMIVIISSPISFLTVKAAEFKYFDDFSSYIDTDDDGAISYSELVEQSDGAWDIMVKGKSDDNNVYVENERLKIVKACGGNTSAEADQYLIRVRNIFPQSLTGKVSVKLDLIIEEPMQGYNTQFLCLRSNKGNLLARLFNDRGTLKINNANGDVLGAYSYFNEGEYTIEFILDLDNDTYNVYYDDKVLPNSDYPMITLDQGNVDGFYFYLQNIGLGDSAVMYLDNIKVRQLPQDAATPKLISCSVSDGETNVNVNDGITLKFDMPMHRVSMQNIKLYQGSDSSGTEFTDIEIKPMDDNTGCEILFISPLKELTQYTLVIPDTVISEDGGKFSTISISFTTAKNYFYFSDNFDSYVDTNGDGKISYDEIAAQSNWQILFGNQATDEDDVYIDEQGRLVATKPEGLDKDVAVAHQTLLRYKFDEDLTGKVYIKFDLELESLRGFTTNFFSAFADDTRIANIHQAASTLTLGLNTTQLWFGGYGYFKDNETHTVEMILDLDNGNYIGYCDDKIVENYTAPLDLMAMVDYMNRIDLLIHNIYYSSGVNPAGKLYIDNLIIKEIETPKLLSSSITDGSTDVSVIDDFTFNFNTEMLHSGLQTIKLYKGDIETGTEVTDILIMQSADKKGCIISPNIILDEFTQYTFYFPETVVSVDKAPYGPSTITFTTGAIPVELSVTDVKVMNSSGVEIDELTAGEGVKVSAKFTNYGSIESKPALFIVALYDGNDDIVKIAYSNKILEPGHSEDIVVEFIVPNEDVTNHHIKIFAWNDFNKMTPLVEPVVFPQRN